MAAGLPVITTRQAGSVVTPEVDGIVIEAGDRTALLTQLQRLHDDRAEATLLGKRARRTIEEKFTWAEYRRRIAELYRDLASSRNGHISK
jgi:glycosyltransferase involved in cell wall biosynthesis